MIGISLLTMVPGESGSGIERYARDLCRGLGAIGSRSYLGLVPTIAPDAAAGIASRVVSRYAAARTRAGRVLAMSRALAFPGPIAREMGAGLEALHYPLTVMIPPVPRLPKAVTIADVQHEAHPEFFSRPELLYRKVVYRRTARAARLVVTLSAFSASSLVRHLGVPAAKIRVIPLGVDPATFGPGPEAREPFLLYPANFWPHKNHARLFEAFALLRARHPGLTLVLTGSGHEGRSLPEGVASRGRVSDGELARLYRTASATVFPSLWEGFGLPVVEAMASGCPVVASEATSLPEVCAGAARLVDPLSPADIARGVEDALAHPRELAEAGRRRAAALSFEAWIRAHDALYGELLG